MKKYPYDVDTWQTNDIFAMLRLVLKCGISYDMDHVYGHAEKDKTNMVCHT